MNNGGKDHYPLDPFNDTVDTQGLRREWEEWFRSFELVVELMNVQSQHEKLVMMLARGGRGLQRIFYNLRPVPEEIYPEPAKVPFSPQELPEFDNAVKRLNKFFIGKRNDRVELEIFRSLRQSTDESFNLFILKLRTQAARCDFMDREEKEILQQVTMGAKDERVRDKGLENVMNLDELMNYAINREVLMDQKQKSKVFKDEVATGSVSAVNAVKQQWGDTRARQIKRSAPRFKPYQGRPGRGPSNEGKQRNLECGQCGSFNHLTDSARCYARNARCNSCGRVGHFARKCRDGWKLEPSSRNDLRRTSEEANALYGEQKWEEELPRRPGVKDIAKVE